MADVDRLPLVIAVLTFRRPRDLADIVPALVEQAASVDADVEILVVDNDPDAGAVAQVRAFAREHPVRYVHEPAPGIAAARNRALEESDAARLLVFIDDDERPEPGWLGLLLETWRRNRAAAVVGPVISRFDEQPDEWIAAGRFFDRRRMPTGTRVEVAATNNLLLDLDVVRRTGARFDARFGISGGSDSVFTRYLHARGGELVWCDEAVVHDIVPADRMTRDWVLRRAYRIGNAWSRINLTGVTVGGRAIVRARMLLRGSIRVFAGSVRFVAGFVTRRLVDRARGLRTAARGAGMLTGAVGSVYSEYKRT
ncbi:glycosyltransferase family 2 protein [Agromyces sp. NPDC058484]|uniref:glycosyltransferase family 2 protein n=1 Tax=Agromyces sp. NPDC058484 TaxID=3346524 RepID=UPI00365A419C